MTTTQQTAPVWVPVKPAGYVRADQVVELSRARNVYKVRTANGEWHVTTRRALDALRGDPKGNE